MLKAVNGLPEDAVIDKELIDNIRVYLKTAEQNGMAQRYDEV